ncbi:acyl-CoA thioesterase [Alicyclobacillus cycloheptanicus]|uniref:Acyl-CoA thioester hydrolase/thioesterase-3 n=1 Tax=Alicyclobacillus cycloheptanicus TaxID=1457 RepID=A0ABT9XJY4_9BACL|nr:thioesterase family protein [Alicyclobacillus cycloheptanicus]MDQ0190590.1 acyl-CoA thioester hydrolase/thioesterase-3 [Alicyclobacillus cycloheptanicus]WDM01426.1 acyl-CoA thioesterase [Alicyclobacillus cycloheptanicus]
MANQSSIEILVRSTEIDVNGHVNNAKYLEYLEWGREDWFEQRGLDYQTLKALGVVTVTAHISADYRKEAVQNDRLRITTRLAEVGNTSMRMIQEIDNQREERVLDATVILVTVDPDRHTKVPVPERIRRERSA